MAPYESSESWDYFDRSYLLPVTRFLAVDPGGEAVNVNALDEVPSSSWFDHRIERLTAADMALGPCDEPDLALAQTRVTAGKPDGMYPGFMLKDSAGQRYMIKIDGGIQGPRNSSSDVVGSRLYFAAGFDVPCNRVVHLEHSQLVVDAKAKVKRANGEEAPMRRADVDAILERGVRLPGGGWRAVASRFLKGRPLGSWTYDGTREDDRNDIVPHEDRRELRGARLLAAWTNHWDSREQNTLAMWIETAPGYGYVRHHLLDFGDCFGTLAGPTSYMARRRGRVHSFDPGQIAADFLTLGTIQRSWDKTEFGPTGPFLGYYDVEDFDPESWSPTYPNAAFGRMTERDAAWMARIIAQIDEDELRAIVATARLDDERTNREWVRVLMGRRQKILARYLTRLSPLARPALVQRAEAMHLCVHDLAFEAGVTRERRYQARSWWSAGRQPRRELRSHLDETGRICVPLATSASASSSKPAYLVVEIETPAAPLVAGPARFHLYQTAPRQYLLAGLERAAAD